MASDMRASMISNKEGMLRINPEYEKLVPRMPEHEYHALRESINTNGQDTPIIVNQDHVVLDGHHRFRACQELGITPDFKVKKDVGTGDAAREYVIRVNLQRRNLNSFQRIEVVASQLEAKEAERAHQRRVQSLRKGRGAGKDGLAPSRKILHNGDGGRVREKCARIANVSSETYRKGREIMKRGPQRLMVQLREGRISIDAAYRQLSPEPSGKISRETPKRINLAEHAHIEEDPNGVAIERLTLTKQGCKILAELARDMGANDRLFCDIDDEGKATEWGIVSSRYRAVAKETD